MGSWGDQSTGSVRCEWGPVGVTAVAAEVVVVIDVLRFTTAVDAAVGHGVAVHPYRWRDATAEGFASSVGAVLVESLSPVSLLAVEPGTSVVLPSPNGSTCAVLAAEAGSTVVAACLRNASAVARWIGDRTVLVVPCGERWPDGSLRPALEDLLGAGAVISALAGARSPEAAAAAAVWGSCAADLPAVLAGCASGRQQVARGWSDDLAFASEVDASRCVPVLSDGRFVDVAGS
jgi:2-phosphosulfolactate phosphatase